MTSGSRLNVPTCATLMKRGDLALAHGDLTSFADIARTLSDHVGDPYAPALLALALGCVGHRRRTSRTWSALCEQIVLRIAIAGT